MTHDRWLFVASVALSSVLAYSEAPPSQAIPEHAAIMGGRDSYLRYCATCHGEYGEADGPSAKNMKVKPRKLDGSQKFKMGKTKEAIFQAISIGFLNSGMAPYDYLPKEEREQMAAFVERMANPPKKPGTKATAKPKTKK